MQAINRRQESSVESLRFNSGVMLSVLNDTRIKSDVARQIIDEWFKHVSQISDWFE